MPFPRDLDLSHLRSWLEIVYIPLFREYREKHREQQDQAIDVFGSHPAVAGRGDAPSDGPQDYSRLYPFPDLGPSPTLPPTTSTSYATVGYQDSRYCELASRLLFGGKGAFEHSLQISKSIHMVSQVQTVVGQAHEVPIPEDLALQMYDGRRFNGEGPLEEPSTDVDMVMLPSFTTEEPVSSDSTEIFSTSPSFRPSTRIGFLSLEEKSGEESTSLSCVEAIRLCCKGTGRISRDGSAACGHDLKGTVQNYSLATTKVAEQFAARLASVVLLSETAR
ncbi:unnamed protein product [Schistocephalus solidus]|uniref:Uncharacterized protein n=1 Tax=Schistocephalus solidus TaxID=70667 RepID=A0A183SAH3_SCHSO|nr:unnamed protein product [Schistocephalus solidus]